MGVCALANSKFVGGNKAFRLVADVDEYLVPIYPDDLALDDVPVLEIYEDALVDGEVGDLLYTVLVDVEDELVVDLHDHIGPERIKPRREVDHGDLDNICSRPLYAGVEGDPLPELPHVLVGVPQLGHVTPPPEECRRVPQLLGLLQSLLHKFGHPRVSLEVALDVPFCLGRVHVPEPRREPEPGDTVKDTEVDHLRPTPELRRHALHAHVEDL